MTNARTFTSHNHATKAAAIAECMRAGMTPWHHATLLLFALPGNRNPHGIARYDTAHGPRWQIAPVSDAVLIAACERAECARLGLPTGRADLIIERAGLEPGQAVDVPADAGASLAPFTNQEG